MAKLFARALDPLVEALFEPTHNEQLEQARLAALERSGFAVVWDSQRGQQLRSLGARLAPMSVDGARWHLERARPFGEAYALMAHADDRELFEALTKALNAGEHARTGPALQEAVAALRAVVERLGSWSSDDLMALETVARLGSADAVRAWLVELK